VVEVAAVVSDINPIADIRTGMMGPENPNWTGGPQAVTCAECGSETTRTTYRTQVKKPLCDVRCYGVWMSAHPEESNRRLRIAWRSFPRFTQQARQWLI
jgi:hypothetical protein